MEYFLLGVISFGLTFGTVVVFLVVFVMGQNECRHHRGEEERRTKHSERCWVSSKLLNFVLGLGIFFALMRTLS